ncbi:type II restriction enzyme [Corynebacterium sp. UMB2355A]|uniref:type II restriction enzyme n=1 Tax=Corynebacterium sp. UMB2355A TaxID=3081222 RepID=UPI0029FEF28A|nr:hypothetical protein [Corynebacterium sp. UMB2355A]WPJ91815.1 hypothetical protein R0V12_05755 [Corynebacterium sp. UMB2355A]
MASTEGKTNTAWNALLEKYPIEETVETEGLYDITAAAIKEFREPRLMTKFDTSDSVAAPLRTRKLNVLPTSRSSYVIGGFNLYQEFPDSSHLTPTSIPLPELETLRIDNLTSESNAINALVVSGALNDFLGEEQGDLIETFNGRMGTGKFDFRVNLHNSKTLGESSPLEQALNKQVRINVNKAQLEIDGGFESPSSVVIMEAKNVINDDFNVRQLYFPYRLYKSRVHKPIRLVFSQFTNLTYHLYEYTFTDPENFSSIELIKSKAYSFEDQGITAQDLLSVVRGTTVTTYDTHGSSDIPFIQADRFDRVLSLIEFLSNQPDYEATSSEVTDFMGLVIRQTAYYIAAARYLGVVDRIGSGKYVLNKQGNDILNLGYKQRQLAYVRLLSQHHIFNMLLQTALTSGCVPRIDVITNEMRQHNICIEESTINRRAQSVASWIAWVLALME